MARPVGENIEKNPTAISRPEGGWFARIWNERSKSVKHLINLGRSTPFTVWVRSIQDQKTVESLNQNSSDSEDHQSTEDAILQVEPISLPPSKAFSIWTEISQNLNQQISSFPIEAFEEKLSNVNVSSLQSDGDDLKKIRSKSFTIWITPEALAEQRFVKMALTNNEKDQIEVKTTTGPVTENKESELSPKASRPVLVPVIFSFLLVGVIIWMFVRANHLATVKDDLSTVKDDLSSAKQDLIDKGEEISNLEETLINERNANQKASLNAKEVARLEIKKANDAFLGKVKEVEMLTQVRDKIKNDYEKSMTSNMQEVQKLKLGIANIEEKNEQAQVQILKANEDNLDLTEKVNSLEKEKGELNKALSDAEVANKKAREGYVAAIQAVENELKATNELLEKEKSNSLMISEKLDLSDLQLKKLMLEIENLNAKIKDLEQPD
ncbi:MAG: hypothetical protein CMO37_04685 [Verrucomicrobiaceae bacterium]|nr:hypothetical protein [Verrucomicrobiaceae bacterium]